MSDFALAHEAYTHAALMGDIVGSEHAVSKRSLYDAFNGVISRANSDERSRIVSPLTITLGDEFQGLCSGMKDAIHLMRRLRPQFRTHGVDCRFVVGVVRIDTPINTEVAWNMMGFGLAATRERLNDKRSGAAYRFALPEHPVVEEVLTTVGHDLTDIERGWSDRQRQILDLLSARTAAQVADEQNLSIQTVYKIRRAAHMDSYERGWRALEASARQLDQAYGLAG